MKELIVYDTNIFVSYFLTLHKPNTIKTVVERILTKEVIPVLSDEIMAEYEDVLYRAKFAFPIVDVRTFLQSVADNGRRVIPIAIHVPFTDESDKCFYDAAVSAPADWLITGNRKHFPSDSFIVTAAQYLERTGER